MFPARDFQHWVTTVTCSFSIIFMLLLNKLLSPESLPDWVFVFWVFVLILIPAYEYGVMLKLDDT